MLQAAAFDPIDLDFSTQRDGVVLGGYPAIVRAD
jgi:hypothetical protein